MQRCVKVKEFKTMIHTRRPPPLLIGPAVPLLHKSLTTPQLMRYSEFWRIGIQL